LRRWRVRLAVVAKVVAIEELRRSPTAALFEGREDIPVSMFITVYERGQGPDLHLHPYAEAFVVQEGTATFTAGEEELVVEAGHVVVVPPETVHGFKCTSDGTLRVVSVHPNPTVEQTDL
jgi:quercetin dioxygenase-like cupin family protein